MGLVTDIRDDLLTLVRQTSANASAPLLVRILTDIRAAVQHIYEHAPDFWSVTEAGAQIQAPASLTGLTLTNGSTSFSGGSLSAYMHGCTVKLSGETQQNEIRQTGASTYALAYPYQGTTTAAGTGTVYCDALNLGAGATVIHPPVFIPGKWELVPAERPQDMWLPGYPYSDHGRILPKARWFVWQTERDIGTPEIYRTERNLTYENQITTRLRLNPLPDAAYALRWQQRNAPYNVTSLSDTVAYLVPHGYNESVLYPVCRWKFAASVDFTMLEDGASRQRIEQDYQNAMAILRTLGQKQMPSTPVEDGTNA